MYHLSIETVENFRLSIGSSPKGGKIFGRDAVIRREIETQLADDDSKLIGVSGRGKTFEQRVSLGSAIETRKKRRVIVNRFSRYQRALIVIGNYAFEVNGNGSPVSPPPPPPPLPRVDSNNIRKSIAGQ